MSEKCAICNASIIDGKMICMFCWTLACDTNFNTREQNTLYSARKILVKHGIMNFI
jgi:hypothetical protein